MFSTIHYLSNAMVTTIIVLDSTELDLYLAKPRHLIIMLRVISNLHVMS